LKNCWREFGRICGGGVILLGLFLSQVGIQRQTTRSATMTRVSAAAAEQVIAARMGFKGL
jgi:hypothetical protein